MQKNITSRKAVNSLLKGLLFLMLLSATFTSFAQPYVNGPFSTGATSSNGTAAPAGSTWSEVQNPNINSGFSASITNNFRLGDDFVVPAGQTWNLSSIVFYGYQTGYASTTVSPFTTVRVTIHSGSITGPVVFGDQTTNRFASSASTNTYRIFNATPGTTRLIWSVTANTVTSLTAGTYWIEYATDVTGGAAHFMVPKTVVGQPTQAGNNGQQFDGTGWVSLVDGTNVQDMAFQVNYTTGAVTACTGTPAPGNTVSTITTGCPGTAFTLSPQNATTGSGVTYQWQSGPSATGPFTNITGATGATYSSTVTATTFYRVIVTCGGNAGTSNPVQVSLTPPSGCYCTPATSDCTDGDIITNVTLGTLNNTSACGANGYTNYTTSTTLQVPTLTQGVPTPISVTAGDGTFTENVAVWIDYNHSGTFDANEFTLIGANAANPIIRTGNITVPTTALLGNTRMRVRVRFSTLQAGTDACTTYTYGETEDYTVNIAPCVPIAITAQPQNASTTCGSNATFSTNATGSGPVYSWEFRVNATSPWQLVTNTAPFSGANTNTLTLTNVPVSFSGYQFRAVISGGCSAPDFTNTATLTVGPLVPVVSPTSATVCAGAGTIIPLSIGNTSSVNTSTFSSAANLNITIPDNGSTTGVNNVINVTTLPASSQITGIKVKMNLVHSWVGDMIVVLKAPNGKVYNLAYALTGTGGAGATTGFTNTVISSTPSATGPYPTLASGSNPYTATFAPDGFTPATGDPTVPTGPNGFIPVNGTVFSDLYGGQGAGNGNWTLAMYDYFADGTTTNKFVNWSIDITYGALAGGVWTSNPATPNTIFTNPTATTPYDGVSSLNTVYVKPNVSTSYSVAINTGTCTGTATIPVTVNTPLSGTPAVANQATCSGSNATFSVTGITGGTGLTYQWQVSTNGGTTFTDIPGATSSTYTVSAATASQGGNQYRVRISTTGCTGSTNSAAGTLTVNQSPVVVISAAPITHLYPGLTTTLTAASSPGAVTSYQWYRNGVAVPGATSNSLVVGIDGLGTYTVKVTDVNGCTNGTAFTSIPSSITISDSSNNEILFIYPSPNSGRFQVRYYTDASRLGDVPYVVNVYDEKGSRVFTRTYSSSLGYAPMNVDLAAHGKGVYRVELTNSRGERIKTGSVMVF